MRESMSCCLSAAALAFQVAESATVSASTRLSFVQSQMCVRGGDLSASLVRSAADILLMKLICSVSLFVEIAGIKS